jgi:hypothetical protein
MPFGLDPFDCRPKAKSDQSSHPDLSMACGLPETDIWTGRNVLQFRKLDSLEVVIRK